MNGLIQSDLVRDQWAISQNQPALQNIASNGLLALQLGCYGYQLYPSAPVERQEPRARELVIERVGDVIRLDYGLELRLLIADPIKGIDLREAVQKLKEALLKER
jgi:hypothetical protein